MLTNSEAMIALDSLQKIVQMKLPIKGALSVRRLVRHLNNHLVDINEVRQKLVLEYADLDIKGNPVVINGQYRFSNDDSQQQFTKEYQELLSYTWECDSTIEASDLGDIEIEPIVLMGLGQLLVE